MIIEKATIHFMTGTGNSYGVATWAADADAARGGEPHLVQIGRGPAPEVESRSATHLVGIVMPTHAFTAPWLMNRVVAHSDILSAIDNPTIRGALQYVSYRFFYHLIKIPTVNMLLTYTTFTHIFRRYHEPDTTIRAIQNLACQISNCRSMAPKTRHFRGDSSVLPAISQKMLKQPMHQVAIFRIPATIRHIGV